MALSQLVCFSPCCRLYLLLLSYFGWICSGVEWFPGIWGKKREREKDKKGEATLPSVRGRCRTRRFCLCRISGNSVFHLACHTEVPKTLASPLSSTTYTTSFPPITTLQMRRLMLRHIYVTCYLLRSLRAVVNILTDLGPFPLFFKKKIRCFKHTYSL